MQVQGVEGGEHRALARVEEGGLHQLLPGRARPGQQEDAREEALPGTAWAGALVDQGRGQSYVEQGCHWGHSVEEEGAQGFEVDGVAHGFMVRPVGVGGSG
ncbi:hypothetical protein GCM10011609_11980 [Lentzea pudingi]|uniref:Uncharacterized protein n=1 Tax=Lentzea pudingi TaxID=1789439 RepID=A0ABQ2HFH1_9PSEU|nr:hypothetical protein GCM10011609_11980 [Lentzea pudingi]